MRILKSVQQDSTFICCACRRCCPSCRAQTSHTCAYAVFHSCWGGYQIANDIQNVTGTDGAFKPASDLVRRTPNAVIVTYRSLLTGELLDGFSSWLDSDDESQARHWHQAILSSGALTLTAEHMMGIVEEAERLIDDLPDDCAQIVKPIHAQLVKATRQCAL